jgi:hypothetical protein
MEGLIRIPVRLRSFGLDTCTAYSTRGRSTQREKEYDKILSPAPVAQWTERRPPEPESTVRVCAGAPSCLIL